MTRSGTILPGITRKSIIELAKQRGYEVQERAVAVEEVVDADELFCTVRPTVPQSHALMHLARIVLTMGTRSAGHRCCGCARRQRDV